MSLIITYELTMPEQARAAAEAAIARLRPSRFQLTTLVFGQPQAGQITATLGYEADLTMGEVDDEELCQALEQLGVSIDPDFYDEETGYE